jgi:hypothetical protein
MEKVLKRAWVGILSKIDFFPSLIWQQNTLKCLSLTSFSHASLTLASKSMSSNRVEQTRKLILWYHLQG